MKGETIQEIVDRGGRIRYNTVIYVIKRKEAGA